MANKTKVVLVYSDFCVKYLDPLIEEANAKDQTSSISTLALYVGVRILQIWIKEKRLNVTKLASYIENLEQIDEIIENQHDSSPMPSPEEVMRNPHDFFSFLRKHEKERKECLERCSRNMSAEDVKRLEQTILTTEDNGYG
jgi:hypothetical protein